MTLQIPERGELEAMRVVELKQLIKDSGLNQRGLLSKLTRKEELISFLVTAQKKRRTTMEMENSKDTSRNRNRTNHEEEADIEVGRAKNAVPSFNEKDTDNNNDEEDIFFSQLFVPVKTNKEIMSSTNQMWSQHLADFLIVDEKLNTNIDIKTKKKKSNINDEEEEEEKKMDALLTPSNYENDNDDDDNFLSNLVVIPEPTPKSETSSSKIDKVDPKQQSMTIDATAGTTSSLSTIGEVKSKSKAKLQVKPKQRKPLGMPSSSAVGSSQSRSKKHAYNDDYIDTTTATPIITTKAEEKRLSEVIREAKVLSSGTAQKYPNPNTSFLSKLYDEVAEVYPTLPYLREGNTTCVGELDVRQQYHPMLVYERKKRAENSSDENKDDKADVDDDENEEEEKAVVSEITPLSGDMDLIFIGTASCTPSMTRGVSCTALRLHSLAGGTGIVNGKSESRYVRRKNQQHNNGENEKDHRSQSQQQQQQQFDVRSSSSSSNLGTWLFDCGEATQLQIQRTSAIRPSKITKIFVTHAHGDHSFGLPGLLCLMGQDTAGGNEQANTGNANVRKTKFSKPPIDIYGPEGLRVWLRVAIRYSVSRIVPRYRVHELKDVAMAPEWGYSDKWEKYFYDKTAFYERHKERQKSTSYTPTALQSQWGRANQQRIASFRRKKTSSDWVTHCEAQAQSESELPFLAPSSLYGEVPGGRDIYPIQDHPLSNDGAPIWEVIDGKDENNDDADDDGDGVRVYAGPMSHGVPCVGYVIQEPNRPGRLRDEYVKPICQRNIPALKKAGFQHPMKALAVIKNLPSGGSFTFPDGTIVTQEEAVEPNRPGRKVVICGDTNSSRSLDKIARHADVVVHEATNTFLHALDHKDANLRSVSREAIFHGHSTPQMAGDFCQRIQAKRLILNHFSARYTGDQSMESISIMTRIEQQAIKASGLSRAKVAAAWDFMIFPIPKVKDTTSVGGGNSDDDDDDE